MTIDERFSLVEGSLCCDLCSREAQRAATLRQAAVELDMALEGSSLDSIFHVMYRLKAEWEALAQEE